MSLDAGGIMKNNPLAVKTTLIRWLFLTALIMFSGVSLSACANSSTASVPTSIPPFTPTVPLEPTLKPTILTETPVPEPPTSLPAFLYFLDGDLFEQTGNQSPHLITSLPQTSSIEASVRLGDQLIVLTEAGVINIDLQAKTSSTVLAFAPPVRYGSLLQVGQGEGLIYQAVVDDFSVLGSTRTYLGLYDLATDKTTPLADFPQAVTALGLSADQENVYLLPRGQDPGFIKVLALSLKTGEISFEMPFLGYGNPVLSPAGNYLVALYETPTTNNEDVGTGILSLKDLNQLTSDPQKILLPHPPSHAEYLVWSPDERYLYFALASESLFSDALEYPRSSYGLWRLEIQTGTLIQVTEDAPQRAPFGLVSSDGRWLLLRHQDSDLAVRLDLPTGALQQYILPVEGVPDFTADWTYASFSKDGAWIFLRYYGKTDVALIHLPSQTAWSFAFPPKAVVVVGWRESPRWMEYEDALVKTILWEEGSCEWEILGQAAQEVYVWAVCRTLSGGGSSGPAVIYLAPDGKIEKVVIPGDGANYGVDIQALFPPDVQKLVNAPDQEFIDTAWDHLIERQQDASIPPLIVLEGVPLP